MRHFIEQFINRCRHARREFLLYVRRLAKHPAITRRSILTTVAALLLVSGALYEAFFRAPYTFPVKTTITIEDGQHLAQVTEYFAERDIVRSKLMLELLIRLHGGDRYIQAGDYYFHERENVFTVSRMITEGDYGLTPIKVRILEGSTIAEMADSLEKQLDRFDRDEFFKLTEGKEGYLYPDTYHFLPNVRTKKVVETLTQTFDEKTAELAEEIEESDMSLHEIVTLASIIEKEARRTATRRMISGILWNRLDIGMALQVDATFLYINGKNTFELTLEDLEHESLYNTYKYPGLPPGPIANPSLDSILAALRPEKNDYLYYLSDMTGETHYARTFDEHKENKFRYLR